MSDIKEGVEDIAEVLEPKLVNEISKALGKVQVEEGWKETMMGVLIESVDNYGAEGLSKARGLVMDLIEGKQFDEDAFNALSLRKQADCVRDLQNLEDSKKSAAKDFFAVVGDTLGGVLVAVAKGMLAKSL